MDKLHTLKAFRQAAYDGFTRAQDAFFELGDAIITTESAPSFAYLSLAPVFRRQYRTLNKESRPETNLRHHAFMYTGAPPFRPHLRTPNVATPWLVLLHPAPSIDCTRTKLPSIYLNTGESSVCLQGIRHRQPMI